MFRAKTAKGGAVYRRIEKSLAFEDRGLLKSGEKSEAKCMRRKYRFFNNETNHSLIPQEVVYQKSLSRVVGKLSYSVEKKSTAKRMQRKFTFFRQRTTLWYPKGWGDSVNRQLGHTRKPFWNNFFAGVQIWKGGSLHVGKSVGPWFSFYLNSLSVDLALYFLKFQPTGARSRPTIIVYGPIAHIFRKN